MTIQRSQERINKTGEVFTPAWLVQEMLDTLPEEVFTDPTKTFLDPAAGDGNFLVQVLARKMLHTNPLQALRTIYGVELMPDNVEVMKARLKVIVMEALENASGIDRIEKAIDKILHHNIVCADSLVFDYDNWQPL